MIAETMRRPGLESAFLPQVHIPAPSEGQDIDDR
jgi:hypothetical protein